MRTALAAAAILAALAVAWGAYVAVRAPVDARVVVSLDVSPPVAGDVPGDVIVDGAPLAQTPIAEHALVVLPADDRRYVPTPADGVPGWPPPAPVGSERTSQRVQIRGDAMLQVEAFVDLAVGRVVFEVLVEQGGRHARATRVVELPGAPLASYTVGGTSTGDRRELRATYELAFVRR